MKPGTKLNFDTSLYRPHLHQETGELYAVQIKVCKEVNIRMKEPGIRVQADLPNDYLIKAYKVKIIELVKTELNDLPGGPVPYNRVGEIDTTIDEDVQACMLEEQWVRDL